MGKHNHNNKHKSYLNSNKLLTKRFVQLYDGTDVDMPKEAYKNKVQAANDKIYRVAQSMGVPFSSRHMAATPQVISAERQNYFKLKKMRNKHQNQYGGGYQPGE